MVGPMTALTTAACPSQRWRLGRAYWRVDRNEGFRKSDYVIDLVRGSVARKIGGKDACPYGGPGAKARSGSCRVDKWGIGQ